MKRIMLLLALLIWTGSALMPAYGQFVGERLTDTEKEQKETLKEIKKEHNAKSVTIERLEDGQIYYVLQGKNGGIGLLKEDKTPLIYKGWEKYVPAKGRDRKSDHMEDFFYGFSPKFQIIGEKRFINVRVVPNYVPGLFDMDGKCIVPPCAFKEIKEQPMGSHIFIKGCDDGKGGAGIFDLDGKYLAKSNVDDFSLYPAVEEGYTDPKKSEIGLSVWHPGYPFEALRAGNQGTLKNNKVVHTDKVANIGIPQPTSRPSHYRMILDGNYYLASSSHGSHIQEKTDVRDMGDGTTGIYKILQADDELMKINQLRLYNRNWELIADSCARIEISTPDQMVYTYRYYGKPYFIYRKGAVSLMDSTLRIPERFNDVIIRNDADGSRKIYVKDWAFGNYREYNAGDQGALSFEAPYINSFEQSYFNKKVDSPDESFIIALGRFNKIPEDSITPSDKAMYLYGVIAEGENGLNRQQKVIDLYASQIDPMEKMKYAMKEIPGVGVTCEGKIDIMGVYRKRVANWRDKAENAADSAKYNGILASIDNMVADMEFNRDVAIPQARDAYMNAVEQQRLQALREEQARQQALRDEYNARMTAAMMGMFSNIFSSATKSSSGRAKSVSSGRASSRGTAMGSRSSSGNSGATDHSGDKARLKREIAEWEAKIKKAAASYEQALESYQRDKSWEVKRVVDSKLKTLNEFAAERDRCIAEYNSYK